MDYIKNASNLLADKKETNLRQIALQIVDNTIKQCNPALLTEQYVRIENEQLIVKDKCYSLKNNQKIFVIGAGKATYPIAKALENVLGDRIHKGVIICKHGEKGTLKYMELVLAAHPTPDEYSYNGALKTIELLTQVKKDDIVIACFTGGSSSLFVSPASNISIKDKAETSKILLTCGANIIEINNVRKHISKVKGGRLIGNLPAGAHLINLTVSDVIGDPLDYITDPSVPDTSTYHDAIATLDKYKLWNKLPTSITTYLKDYPEKDKTLKDNDLSHIDMQHIVLLPADAACSVAINEAQKAGYNTLLLSSFFEGESCVLGQNFVAIAKQVKLNCHPIKPPCCIIGGGETTVTINTSSGQGGPNQEFALSAAKELDGIERVVVIGIDTDGTDGPTPYAGGVVDGGTIDLARKIGININDALRQHNVSEALYQLNDIIITGNTGTNVNDLKLMIID